MMDQLRQYVTAVTAAALLGGILAGLTPNPRAKELIRMLCGLFLTISILQPFTDIDLSSLDLQSWLYNGEGAFLASEGETMAGNARRDIIKAKTQAYILDKAADLNAELTVEVFLSGDDIPVPSAVVLHGNISPYARQQLSHMMAAELGISTEEQQWTG